MPTRSTTLRGTTSTCSSGGTRRLPQRSGLFHGFCECLLLLADGRGPRPVAEKRQRIRDAQWARERIQLAIVVARQPALVAGGRAKPVLELLRTHRLELRFVAQHGGDLLFDRLGD